MTNLILTYDTIQDGEVGEACVAIPLEHDRAAQFKAAFEHSPALHKGEAFELRDLANRFCASCEKVRRREYVDESIKSVELREV